MKGHSHAGFPIAVLSVFFCATAAFAQTVDAIEKGPAAHGSPAWFLEPTATPAAPGGRGSLPECVSDTAKLCSGLSGVGVRACLTENLSKLSRQCKVAYSKVQADTVKSGGGILPCARTTVCDPPLESGGNRSALRPVAWEQNLGYTFAYPFVLPEPVGGVTAVAVDSKDNLWSFQRTPEGRPQLTKFGPDHKVLLQIGDDVITRQYKAHGIAVDAHDNIWICDANGATVKELSPDGKLLKTIGVRGHAGDWDEAKGQRLLWQPMMISFAPNGDIYIGEGHAEESPNDVGSSDPTNNNGAARVIRLDKNGKFIQQWYGDQVGQGKFSMVHGIAVDPKNGDVYVGDREEYRYVVFTADGKFLRTVQMRNLVCALYFDPRGNLWIATGGDGQIVKVDKLDGRVLGAIGKGNGQAEGYFGESAFMGMDSHGDLYAGDTGRARIAQMVPKK